MLSVITLVAFAGALVSVTRAYSTAVYKATDDLHELFLKDKDRWWWEKELPRAIERSSFITRAALRLLDKEGKLRKREVSINGIRAYSLYPRVKPRRLMKGRLYQIDSLT